MSKHKILIKDVFNGLQRQMLLQFDLRKRVIHHPGFKGAENENTWLEVLRAYLPTRYSMDSGFVIDSKGHLSEQQDIIIYDRHFSPFIFEDGNALYVPVESVYAVFEIKSEPFDQGVIKKAAKKAASVRKLTPKVLDNSKEQICVNFSLNTGQKIESKPILAGVLAYTADWSPPFGKPFIKTMDRLTEPEQLNLGCVLDSGSFCAKYYKGKDVKLSQRDLLLAPAETGLSSMVFKLLSWLQIIGTVAPIDLGEYLKAATLK